MDGTLNVFDIIVVVNHMLNTEPLTEQQTDIADINHDGIIDIFAIVELVDLILG